MSKNETTIKKVTANTELPERRKCKPVIIAIRGPKAKLKAK